MSPRWYDKRTGDYLALDTGGGPIARFWATALAGIVDIGYIKATGNSVKIYLPKTTSLPEVEFEWKIPKWSNAIERDRARTYFQAYAAAAALYFAEQALAELHAGRTKTWTDFKVPEEAIGCGFHEAVRGVLSHHVVIRDGKIANYHPYPPTPWNANPRDIYGTPGPYEDAVQNTPIFEENGPDKFKGIDIMRAVRSFDPCLPCGVHMYLGNGKVLETHHSPMFGVGSGTSIPRGGADVEPSILCRADPEARHSQSVVKRRRVANGNEFQEQVRQLGKLITQFDQMPEGPQKTAVQGTRAASHGRARSRPRKNAWRSSLKAEAPAPRSSTSWAATPITSSLLLLYSLHPDDLGNARAQSDGTHRLDCASSRCSVELAGIEEGAVQVRVTTERPQLRLLRKRRAARSWKRAFTKLAPDVASLKSSDLKNLRARLCRTRAA